MQREVDQLVQAMLRREGYQPFSILLPTAAAGLPGHREPVTKQLNLTKDYERARSPATNEQVQNWIDQISMQASAQLTTERYRLADWDVYVIGQQASQTAYGYAAELQTSRVLVLRNYGTAMGLDSMSLGCSHHREQQSAVGAQPHSCSLQYCYLNCSPMHGMHAVIFRRHAAFRPAESTPAAEISCGCRHVWRGDEG